MTTTHPSPSRRRTLSPRRHRVAVLLTALVAAVAAVGLGVPSSPARADSAPADPTNPATPTTVTADALPTVQIDGVVWSQAVVGNRVYVGGDFATARPAGAAAGTSEVSRPYLLAYDIRTGELIDSFAPVLNGQVRAVTVSPDKSRVYVAGTFTTVDGQTRNRVAAFDAATGALIAGFRPNVNYDVYALAATDTTVYVGGNFQGVGTNDRNYLAAFTSGGALLDWAPSADNRVWALTVSPDGSKVAIGGQFATINGSSNPGNSFAIVDGVTGAVLPTAINAIVRNAGTDSAITSLATQGNTIYGGAYSYGNRSALEGAFAASWDGGTTTWIGDCHGDVYSVFPQGGVLYMAGHTHYCGNIGGFPESSPSRTWQRGLALSTAPTRTVTREFLGYANFQGQPGPELLTWFPRMNPGTKTGLEQGPWSVDGNSDYIVYGGEFTTVNNKPQQGLVRFAKRTLAPRSQGPSLFGASYPIKLTSTAAGRVRVTWQTNEDQDNESLTYRVYRGVLTKDGKVYEQTAAADYWAPYAMGFTDTGLTPGQTYQYRLQVSDPDGNIAWSPWSSVTVAAGGTESAYSRAVYDSQPSRWWRFSETSGSSVADAVSSDPLTLSGTVGRNTAGPLAGDTDPAATIGSAVATGQGVSTTKVSPPNEFSIETWFKTGTAGGKLIGFGDKASGTSGANDRTLYLDNTGKLYFGVNNGSLVTVNSPLSYTDNAWHQAVATLSASGGMKLYVDGVLVAQRADVWFPRTGYWGWWRVGYDTLLGWPNRPTSYYYRGALDEISIYPRALGAAEIVGHFNAAKGANVAPRAELSVTTSDLRVDLDATASGDSDGSIVSYAWDFGDGTTDTGATASHTYAAAGTYQVRLTVTDDRGATTSAARSVTVIAPNVPPTASFTAGVQKLVVTVDASASTDPDGSIVSYAWSFGDGATATGASATHAYAAPGSYPVTLTVTDDRGGSTTSSRTVTVVATQPFATDQFNRTVTGGWGSSDVGGDWVRTGSAANFSVAPGAASLRMTAAGSGPKMALPTVSSSDTEVRTRFSLDVIANGNGAYANVEARTVGADAYYASTRVLADGRVSVALMRRAGGVVTTLQTLTVPGLVYAVGDRLEIKVQAVGTGTTALRAKVWKSGAVEPDWQVSTTDTTASLQTGGSIALWTYLSGSSTNVPVVGSYHQLWAGPTP